MNTATMNYGHINNPIKILNRLKEAGFSQKQAEVQVEILTDYIDHNLVTKQDLKQELKLLRQEIKHDLQKMEFRIMSRTAIMMTSIVGFFYTLEKFF